MKKILLLATTGMLFVPQAFASDTSFADGKKLFQENCLSCHNAQLDPPQAPPMFGVQRKYKKATSSKEGFVNKVTSFATHPTEEKALFKKPVQMLGLMPDMGFEKKDVKKIASYIHDETFSAPCNHWQSAMKRFKSEGDAKQYKKHKNRYDMMCQKASPKEKGSAPSDSLKGIMQQLGRDYSAIDDAILMEDFDAAAKAAHGIAFHETPSMGQKMKLKGSFGSEMKNFKKADGLVHNLALDIEKAAKAKDMKALIKHQSKMLKACMSCHTTFRARAVKILH